MSHTDYFILSKFKPNTYLLLDPDISGKSLNWLDGIPFKENIELPVRVRIKNTTIDCEPVDCFTNPFVVSEKFLRVLQNFGVNNIDAYDAVLVNEKAGIYIEGYKAINIIALQGTANASLSGLGIEPSKTNNLLVFRLAEDTTRIVVHKSIKEYLEELDCFPELWFRELGEFFSI